MSCDHSSGQSGASLYVRGSGRVRLVLVCDTCGAVQGELGALDYKPRPALPPAETGEVGGPLAWPPGGEG